MILRVGVLWSTWLGAFTQDRYGWRRVPTMILLANLLAHLAERLGLRSVWPARGAYHDLACRLFLFHVAGGFDQDRCGRRGGPTMVFPVDLSCFAWPTGFS